MQNLKDYLGPFTLHPRENFIFSLPHAICLMGVIQVLFIGSGAGNSVGLPEILHVIGAYLPNSTFIPFGFTAGAWDAEVGNWESTLLFSQCYSGPVMENLTMGPKWDQSQCSREKSNDYNYKTISCQNFRDMMFIQELRNKGNRMA